MAKQLIITQCSECHHQIQHRVLGEDGYEFVNSATCGLTNTTLEYAHYSQIKLKPECAFPSDCPLDDADDMDKYDYNFISEKIKNAKNVREGRYG